ncbi:LamG-like jellyroll fold domain-containing protein [Planctomycetota bacterium]
MIETLNNVADKWFAVEVAIVWQVAVLIAIVWVIDLLIRKWAWPQVRYALWLLILIKLILPPSLTSPASFTAEIPFIAEKITKNQLVQPEPQLQTPEITELATAVGSAENPQYYPQAPVTIQPAEVAAAAVPLSWKAYAFFVWLTGCAALSLWLIVRLSGLRREQLRSQAGALPDRFKELLESTAGRLNLKKVPQVILTDKVNCPAVFGVIRPVLLMPAEKFSSLTRTDLEHILLHELAHIKRGDLKIHAFYMLLQIAYWFNPLLWLIRRPLQNLRELCCDATVARLLKEKTHHYRETLLETARQLLAEPVDPGLGLLGLFENSNRLIERLKWLERKTWKNRPLRIATIFILISLMATCVIPMAKPNPAPPPLIIRGTVTDSVSGDPIAGAKVFDDGYADADWERIESGFYEPNLPRWGAITDANGNYAFLTWPEHHSFKIEATGYKPKGATLYSGHFSLNKKNEEIFNYALEEVDTSKQSEFKATLPNGVTVELVGICEHPSEGKQWWRGDGNRLGIKIVTQDLNRYKSKDPGYEFAFKFVGDDFSVRFKDIKGSKQHSGLTVLEPKGIQALRAHIKSTLRKTKLKVGIAAGEWQTIATHTGRGTTFKKIKKLFRSKKIIFSAANETKDGLIMTVSNDLKPDNQTALFAIDTDGTEHMGGVKSSLFVDNQLQETFEFTSINIEDIKEFQYRTRPYEWIEFKNVSLKPNFKTDVQIEVEKPIASENTEDTENKQESGRKFVSLVVPILDLIYFEGKKVESMEEMVAVLQKVPDPERTVIQVVVSDDVRGHKSWKVFEQMLHAWTNQYNFAGWEYVKSATDAQKKTEKPQPVAYWNFDGDADDKVGSNHGTVYGATLTRGISGQGYYFEGDGDCIEIPNSKVFDFGADDFTLSAWFRIDALKKSFPFVMNFRQNDNNPHIELYAGGDVGSHILPGFKRLTYREAGIDDDRWHHIAISMINGQENGYKLYLDGLEVAKNTYSGRLENWDTITIGGQKKNGKRESAFKGFIDEIAIYKRALTTEQINKIYQEFADTSNTKPIIKTTEQFTPDNSLAIKSVVPNSPAILKLGEKLNVDIHYQLRSFTDVQIWARPQTKGRRTHGYKAHGSRVYHKTDSETGIAKGYFFFDKPTSVDEIRVRMKDKNTGETQTIFYKIDARWIDVNSVNTSDGLIGYWNFDKGNGNIAYDSAGGNNAMIQGANWAGGIAGSGLNFDGIDDYVNCGSNANLDLTEFTWSLWIKRAEQWHSDERALISTDRTDQDTKGAYGLQIDTGSNFQNKLQFVRHGDPFSACLWSNATVADTKWHHIAATRNNQEQAVLYIDGQPQGQGRLQTRTDFKGFIIGAGHKAYSNFKGIIDEVKIYDRPLSSKEIKSIYDSLPVQHHEQKPAVQIDVESGKISGVVGVQDSALGKSTSAEAAFVIQKVLDRYAGIKTYSATGELLTDVDRPLEAMGARPGMTAKMLQKMSKGQLKSIFTIKMARPVLYCIQWREHVGTGITKDGNVWSVGDGSHGLIHGKEKSFEKPLRGLIPAASNMGKVQSSLFFDTSLNRLKKLRNLSQQPDQQLEGLDCYVISGSLHRRTYTYWISKKDFLICQYKSVSGGDGKAVKRNKPELTDESIKATLKEMDKEVTPEEIAKMRALLSNAMKMSAKVKITKKETYRNIVIDQPISKEEFVPRNDIDEAAKKLKKLQTDYTNRLKKISTTKPNIKTQKTTQFEGEESWGEAVEGIQIRLLADSTIWKFGQTPTFKCDVRNNGPHKWKLPLSQREYLLEVDGHNFTYPGKAKKWKLIKSGEKLSDLAIRADAGWVRGGMFPDYYLALRPGKHTIRLGVVPRPARRILPPKPSLCMSNPITVEVVPIDGMGKDSDPPGMTIYGKRNTLKLSSWDRRRGNCGFDFDSGRIMTMPADVRKASESKRLMWIREQGIDAVASISEQGHGLIGIDLAVENFEKYPWREITAERAQELMRNRKVAAGKTSMLGPTKGSYRHHYLVKTRGGDVFQLNIDAGHNSRKNVQFSYRRVQQTVDSISVSRTTRSVGLGVRPPIDECSGISIETPNNWKLHINKDGSAVLYFGNSDRSPQFPVGSFKFDEAYSSMASVQHEHGTKYDRPYKIAFHIPNTRHDNPSVRSTHYTSSFNISVGWHKNLAELFDKADALSGKYWKAKEYLEGVRLRNPIILREHNPIIQPVTDMHVEGEVEAKIRGVVKRFWEGVEAEDLGLIEEVSSQVTDIVAVFKDRLGSLKREKQRSLSRKNFDWAQVKTIELGKNGTDALTINPLSAKRFWWHYMVKENGQWKVASFEEVHSEDGVHAVFAYCRDYYQKKKTEEKPAVQVEVGK